MIGYMQARLGATHLTLAAILQNQRMNAWQTVWISATEGVLVPYEQAEKVSAGDGLVCFGPWLTACG